MKASRLLQFNIAVFFGFHLLFCFHALAQSKDQENFNENLDYGDLYLLEEKNIAHRMFSINAALGYEFGNPFYDVVLVNSGFDVFFNRYVSVGGSISIPLSSQNGLGNQLIAARQINDRQVVDPEDLKPIFSAFGVTTIRPFYGHLNFFGHHRLPFHLSLKLGGGASSYAIQDRPSGWRHSFLWEAATTAHLSSHIAVSVHFGQMIDGVFANDTNNRPYTSLGMSYQF